MTCLPHGRAYGLRAVLAAVCAGCMLCVPAVADRKAKPAKENRRAETRAIESLEERWRTAIISGDAATMDKLLSDDFLAISARGTLMDKQQYLQRISTHTTQLSTFDLMDMKVRVQPGSAVVVSQAHINGVLEGSPIQGVFRYTKVYTHAPGGLWQMTNFEATRVAQAGAHAEQDGAMPHGERTAPATGSTSSTSR